MVKGDGEGKGMEKRRGMVKGRAYLGPCCHSLGVLDPCRCLCACVSRSCHCWAVSPRCHCVWHGRVVVLHWRHVVVGPCRLLIIVACLVVLSLWLVLLVGVVVLSLSCRCAVSSSSLPSHVVVMPCVVLCLSKVCWEEWGMRGAHHGVLAMTTNDVVIRHLVATSPSATWHLDLMSEK